MSSGYEINMEGPPSKKQRSSSPPPPTKFDSSDWNLLNEFNSELPDELGTLGGSNVPSANAADSGTSSPSGNGSSSNSSTKKADDTIQRNINLSLLLSSNNDPRAPIGSVSLPQQMSSSSGHMNLRYPMSQHPQPHPHQQQQQQMMMMYQMQGQQQQRQGFGAMQHGGGFVGGMNSGVYARAGPVAANYPLRHPDFVRQKSLPASMSYFPDDVRTIRMNGFPHADPMAMDRGFGRGPFPMRGGEVPDMCNPNVGVGVEAAMQAKMVKMVNGMSTTTMSRVLPCGNGKSLAPAPANPLQATCNLSDAKAAMPKSGSTGLGPTGKMGVLSPETNVFPISPAAPPETPMEGPAPAPPQPPPSMPVINPEKRREVQEVQQKLVLLLHAHKCQRKDQTNGAISFICQVTGCSSMKTLLKHMTECQEGKSCKVQHCAALRQIITHWKNCDRPDCPICSPLKNRRTNAQTAPNKSSGPETSTAPPTPATQQVASLGTSVVASKDEMTRTYETLGLDPNNHLQRSNTNSSLQGATGVGVVVNPGKSVAGPLEPVVGVGATAIVGNVVYDTSSKPTKDWHHSVIQDLRNHLIHKLVQAIFPTPDPTILKNDRMNNVVQYAKKVEGDMYETASSREEYYLLLAEKIYKIQKELEEKRMKRMIDTGNTQGAMPGFVHGGGSNDSQVDSGFSSPPLTSMYLMSQSPGGVSRLGNEIYGDMGPANTNMLRATRGDQQFLGGPRLGLDVYAKRMPQPPPGAGMPYGCQDALQPSNGQANRMIGPVDNQSHLSAVAPDVRQQQSMADAVFCRKEQVDLPKPDTLSSLPPNLQSLPPNARQPVSTPPVSSISQPDISFAETLSLQPACDSPREIIGAKPGSVLPPCATVSSPADQIPTGEKVVPPVSDTARSSPFFKDATEVPAAGNLEPKSPKDFKYDTSTAHEDISDDEVVTAKPEAAPVEAKVEVKEEVMQGPEDTAERKRIVPETSDEATVSTGATGVKAEDGRSEECGDVAVVKVESSSLSVGTENGAPATCGGEGDGEKMEVGRKVWQSEELLQALFPTWEKLCSLEPEAAPFRYPVNPEELGIPDYFDIVKNPIDLSTIRAKLEGGEYSDPWQYVDDIGLMFDNAWLYNRKTSRVYKFCSKLAEVFEGEIDGVMQSLGFCCGRRHVFSPQVLCCFGKQLCAIPRDTIYYNYQDRYIYCEKCFNELNGDDIEMADDPSQPGLKIKKGQFVREKNDKLDRELFVDCQDCGRKMHKICVLYMEQIWPEGFICRRCVKGKGVARKENKYTAKRLPSTKLGTYLETRVNSLLKRKDAGAGEVTIRVLSSYDKAVDVKPGMRSRFLNSNMPETFPYRVKAMFAFEEIDGIDVCFFGMHVQEYGSDCRAPNARRVYIAYLDSVHFFQPKQFRTMVYHEILIGYMDYVKTLGFQTAHIWACPPSEGDDYIFHCHPPDQKIPKPKRLQEWYKKMLDKALNDRVIFDYKDILKDAIDNSFQSVTEIPYFEGDFWPNILEECIKELEQEEVEKRLREEEEAAADTEDLEPMDRDSTEVQPVAGKKKGQKNNSNTKKKNTKNKKPSNRKSKSGLPHCGNDLTAKLLSTMEKHKEGFFVVRLQPSLVDPHEIKDPDPLINCDLMDGRDAFLTLSRDKHYEFSSLRRAKFSTMGLLYELHTQAKDGFIYTCNDCKANVETRYHCSVCDDYDLCVPCYQTSGHPHKSKMTRLGLDLDEGSGGSGGGGGGASDAKSQNSQEARRVSLQTYIQSLVHACHCRDANCHRTICQKMKRLVQHVRNCKRRQNNNSCPVCKQLLTLCWNHAKTCKETKCPVPFCTNMKQKLDQQHAEQQFKQNQLLRRRMAIMQRAPDAEVAAPGASQGAPGASGVHQDPGRSDPPTPTTAVPHGYGAGGKFMHGPGCQSPPPQSMMNVQQHRQQMELAGHRAMGQGGYLGGGGGNPMGMMHQRQFVGAQMMDQGGMWQHEMYPGMQAMARSHDEMMYAPQQQQHMMGPVSHGPMGPQACMPGMGPPGQHAMEAMAGMQGPGGVSQQQVMGGASASSQMAMLLAKRMKAPGSAGAGQMASKDMVGFVKGNPQLMSGYMKQSQPNSEHALGPQMSGAGHMMDDMIDDPNYAMGGHMSMMSGSMGGMRPMMVDQMGGQGAGGAGRMASPQWIQHQQQMRCMPSEYQRYPTHMSHQGMAMYGAGGGGAGGLPPQVQRVRMNFGGGGGGGHPQGFPPGSDGGMMAAAQYDHMQQQHQHQHQQQQMMMHQKRMQLKSQMAAAAAAASIRSGPPAGMQAQGQPQSMVSQQQQRGLGQLQMDMQQAAQQAQQQQQQPSQQQQSQQQATAPSQAPSQQPVLPCSLPAPSSGAPGGGSASGLRPTTQGLAKRAPSPRRPPPHYADTVSMQSMVRMQRMMPGGGGVMAPQHEMTGYGAEQSHLRFPMAPDYGQSLGGAPMEPGVQQFPSGTHSSLARYPNNMPQ